MANTSSDTAAIEVEAREQVLTEPPRGDRTPESLADLFAPDVILPEQFFEGARRDSQASGEKALMLAVLEDGIRCFQEHLRNPRSNPRLLSQQAEAWIRAVDYEWPFSFNNVCETLGIDPSALRLQQRVRDARHRSLGAACRPALLEGDAAGRGRGERRADAGVEEGLPAPSPHQAREHGPLADRAKSRGTGAGRPPPLPILGPRATRRPKRPPAAAGARGACGGRGGGRPAPVPGPIRS